MLKNLNSFIVTDKQLYFFLVVFTLLPFIGLAFYNLPIGDDFLYASTYQKYGLLNSQNYWYFNWSGRYLASLAISLCNPLSYGTWKYAFILPLFLILSFTWALRSVLNNFFSFFSIDLDKKIFFALVLFYYFNYLPDLGESIYWCAGACTYQLPNVFFLIYINHIINLLKNNKLGWSLFANYIGALISAFVVCGCNEIIALYLVLVTMMISLFAWLNAKSLRLLGLIGFAVVCLYLMISAPGNFERAKNFSYTEFRLIKVVFQTMSRGGFVFFFWFFSFGFLMLLFPLQLDLKLRMRISKNIFNYKRIHLLLMSLILLFFIVSFGFFPSLWATNWVPKRAYTPVFFIFIGLSIFWFNQMILENDKLSILSNFF